MVATASKLISFLMSGLFAVIFLIPQAFPHKTEANLGLMTLRSVVSQSFSSGKALVLSNEFAGFRNFWNRSQGSFLSHSRRFLVIPKARFIINTSFKTLSPSPRILEAKTIDFGLVAPRFQRLVVLAPCLGASLPWSDSLQGRTILPQTVSQTGSVVLNVPYPFHSEFSWPALL